MGVEVDKAVTLSCEELDCFLWVPMWATQMRGPHDSIQNQCNLKKTHVIVVLVTQCAR